MVKLSIKEIAQITGGEVVMGPGKAGVVKNISTDSRTISPESLFVALKGENFNGHDFISDALKKKAKAVCVSEKDKLLPGEYYAVLVEDTLSAYQKIASYQRKKSGYTVVGITGSVGKTTTRQFVVSAISGSLKTYSTRNNYNNEIGLPMTILETPPGVKVSVLEMGMRGMGEIRLLSEIARPDIAVITNIGVSHIERLKTKENIFKAKTEITHGLSESGLLILNTDDPILRKYCNSVYKKIGTCAVTTKITNAKADVCFRAFDISYNINSICFKAEVKTFDSKPVIIDNITVPAPGRHNVINALTALAVATELDICISDVLEGLKNYTPPESRQRIIETDHITIIDDSYNSSPDSLEAAVNILGEYKARGNKIAVLGGMLELGTFSKELHEKAGENIVKKGIDVVLSFGDLGKDIIDGGEKYNKDNKKSGSTVLKWFPDEDNLSDYLQKNIKRGDVVLVKGSRAFKMEKIVETLKKYKSGNGVD